MNQHSFVRRCSPTIVAAAFLAIAASAGAEPGFVPGGMKGQKWQVEARYTMMDLGGDNARPSDELSPPSRWEYTVANVKDAGQLRYYQLVVKAASGKDPRRSGLIFIASLGKDGRPQTLALAKATFENPVRGVLSKTTRDYRRESGGPHPVLCEDSLIPCDAPCFSRESHGPSVSTTFEVTEIAGGLPFARDILQTISRAAGLKHAPAVEPIKFRGPQEPIRPRVKADPARNLDFMLSRPSDGAAAHQIWNPAFPWFLYGRSDGGVAYLVEADSQPSPGKAPSKQPDFGR